MKTAADEIIELYERHADTWDHARGNELIIETCWLTCFQAHVPSGGRVLDIGCGSGQPIAGHLIDNGFAVTGVDSSPTLIAKCRRRFPRHEWIVGDMRVLSLKRRYQGIIVWDSFFHLPHDAQRAMFSVFHDHAAPGAAVLLTTGFEHGEAIGCFQGERLYHASLSTVEYRKLFSDNGFNVIAHRIEDPDCGNHTVWLAQRQT